MSSLISVSLSTGIDKEGIPCFILTIQKPDWEMNIWMAANELALIPNVRTAHWSNRESIKLGECAGSPTFWSCENGNISILVGPDDECWDIAVTLPEELLDDMITEIDRESKTS
jgi:hypothetical protein